MAQGALVSASQQLHLCQSDTNHSLSDVVVYVFPVGVTPDPSSDAGTVMYVTLFIVCVWFTLSLFSGAPLPEAAISSPARYDIDIPDAMDAATCDFGALTILDRTNSRFLARVVFTTALFVSNGIDTLTSGQL